MRISEILAEDNVELDRIEDIIINTWNSVYPDVDVKVFEDDYIYVKAFENPHSDEADFTLAFGVYEPDEEDPDFNIIVGWAYSGEYRGYIGKLFGKLFQWGKQKYPDAEQNLVVQMDKNPEAWSNMADKLGVNYLSEANQQL